MRDRTRTGTQRTGPAKQWEALQGLWEDCRARLAKFPALHNWFGLSVPEPHKDGTPHLHAMVWLPPQFAHSGRVRQTGLVIKDILHNLAPGRQSKLEIVRKRPDQIRPDGTVRRFASPAAYCMKYVLKSLDDEESLTDQGEAGERHRAWAASRGLRRMRIVGSHGSLTVWQRLWISPDDEPLPPQAAAARAAMQRSRAAGERAVAAASDSPARQAARKEQAAAAAEALLLIGGLPGARIRYGLEYEEAETAYGRPTKRAVRIIEKQLRVRPLPDDQQGTRAATRERRTRITYEWQPTGEAFPLKRQQAELVSLPREGVKETVVTVNAINLNPRAPSQEEKEETAYICEMESLIRQRKNLPQWQQWCADGRRRLDQLRGPPTDTASNTNTSTIFATAEAA